MKTSQKIRLYNLIVSGFLYALMTLFIPMASGGVAIIAEIFAPISLVGAIICSFIYYYLTQKEKTKMAEFFFWTSISLMIILYADNLPLSLICPSRTTPF